MSLQVALNRYFDSSVRNSKDLSKSGTNLRYFYIHNKKIHFFLIRMILFYQFSPLLLTQERKPHAFSHAISLRPVNAFYVYGTLYRDNSKPTFMPL